MWFGVCFGEEKYLDVDIEVSLYNCYFVKKNWFVIYGLFINIVYIYRGFFFDVIFLLFVLILLRSF